METFTNVLNFLSENWKLIAWGFTALVGAFSTVKTSIKNKNWAKLKESVADYVQQAEQLAAAGVIKKEIVLSKARTLCVALKIKFDEQKVSDMIEGIVALTKAVNARAKDKPPEQLPETAI